MKKNIIKNQDGATIIEFAFLAPILFLLLMGIVELGLFFFASNVIENATAAASRFSITNSTYQDKGLCPGVKNRNEFIRCAVDFYSSGLLDTKKLRIQTSVIRNGGFESVNPDNYGFEEDESKPIKDPTDYGGPNESVVYRVSYRWEFFTPMVGKFFNNGIYDIQSTILVKNENFEE